MKNNRSGLDASACTQNVLIVDDDEGFASGTAEVLKQSMPGVCPLVATSLSGAMDLIREHPMLAAVVDLDLGDGFGMEVIDTIAKADADTPIILMSGYLQSELEPVERRLRDDHEDLNMVLFDKTDSTSVLVEVLRRVTASADEDSEH